MSDLKGYLVSLCLLSPCLTQAAEPPAPFTISIDGVQEICVEGTASAQYWGTLLAAQGLVVVEEQGHASLLVCATQLKWGGANFREVIVTVRSQSGGGGAWRDGYYLVGALNSKRSFAWVERHRNHSPYAHGQIVLTRQGAASSLEAHRDGVQMLKMSHPNGDDPGTPRDIAFEGPIFLPSAADTKYLFYASLTGEARTWPFDAQVDIMELGPSADGVTQALVESQFQPRLWIVKDSATHQKSDSVTW